MTDLSNIHNLNELYAAKASLLIKIEKREHSLDKSFIIAKRHIKDIFSLSHLFKEISDRVLTIDRIFANPQSIFKVGTTIGRKISTFFNKKEEIESHPA